MHGLRTSSVLILDDNDEEALAIQKSLASCGIGAIFVPGAPDEERPDDSVTGVRVAVLDIYLGVGTSVEAQVSHTTNIVNDLIDRENGPYVAIVWTSNPDDFDLFVERLSHIDCPPVCARMLDKGTVLGSGSQRDQAQKILSAVRTALNLAPLVKFSNLWEQVVRDASNDTVVSLHLAKHPGSGNATGMSFLVALLDATADDNALQSDRGALRALLSALNPVHFDKVEEQSVRWTRQLKAAVAPIRRATNVNRSTQGNQPLLSLVEQASLNTAMLFDRHARGFGAGHIYGFSSINRLRLGPALPTQSDIRESTVLDAHLPRARKLPVIFLEVSAPCDHQQGRAGTARLIAGVAFAASTFKRGASAAKVNMAHGNHVRDIKPLQIAGRGDFPADEVVLVWNSHYPVSVPAERLSRLRPIGRLREPPLADVRAWLGYQASRPGYASV